MTKSSILGYPRIGDNREWKKALEAFWAGKIEESEFQSRMQDIRLNHLRKLQEKGIDLIPVNDFSYYDHVLDTAAMFGIVPKRFPYDGGPVPLSVYYGIARGTTDAAASEMTKWFNTNYHYIVPELDGAEYSRYGKQAFGCLPRSEGTPWHRRKTRYSRAAHLPQIVQRL